MSIKGWYYLHINGALIYKPEHGETAADIRDSDFAKGLWPCDPSDREGGWTILVEGLAAGADPARIKELAEKWGCNNDDAAVYAQRIGVTLQMDGSAWLATGPGFVDLQVSSCYGFGSTALEALAELAKAIGYTPSKMWGVSFKDLLRTAKETA